MSNIAKTQKKIEKIMAPPGEQIKLLESQGHFLCDFEAIVQEVSEKIFKDFHEGN